MSDPSLFREQALAHHAAGRRSDAILRLQPTWSRYAWWLLVAVSVAAVGFGLFARIHEYAVGPAVVRVEGRLDLTATSDGTVADIRVQPGQRVAEGEPLVQFFMEREHAELARIDKEIELQLLKQLRDPADSAARQTLSGLRAERDLAAARLDERLVRAPRAGVVSDVRIRPGQHLAVGELILTLVADDARLTLVALLPGRYRPMLAPGQPLRFELSGYRYEYRELTVEAIGDEIVGPAEARRYLGPGIADGVELDEPVVLVRATLPAREFVSEGRTYRFFDGLHAVAQARVRSERVLVALLPELKGLLHHGR